MLLRTLLSLTVVSLALASGDALAQDIRLAIPKIKGSSKASPSRVDAAMRKALRREDIRLISPRRLAAAGRRKGVSASSLAAAKATRADYLARVRISTQGRKHTARVTLIEVKSGRIIKEFGSSYRKRSLASKKGSYLGRKTADAIWANMDGGDAQKRQAEAPKTAPSRQSEPAVAQKTERTARKRPDRRGEAASKKQSKAKDRGKARAQKEDREEAVGEARREDRKPSKNATNSDLSAIRIQLGAGSQAYTAYSVTVGSKKTGLAYTVPPLIAADLSLSWRIPDVGFGGDFWGNYVPVSYNLNVNPPINPAKPKGAHIYAGGDLFYEFELSRLDHGGSIRLGPVVAAEYRALSVEAQNIILSHVNIELGGGLRFVVQPKAALALQLDAQYRMPVSYKETPRVSGNSPKGMALLVKGELRYWLNDIFGFYGRAGYHYAKLDTKGAGTRAIFTGDPALVDASVYHGEFLMALGVGFAL